MNGDDFMNEQFYKMLLGRSLTPGGQIGEFQPPQAPRTPVPGDLIQHERPPEQKLTMNELIRNAANGN